MRDAEFAREGELTIGFRISLIRVSPSKTGSRAENPFTASVLDGQWMDAKLRQRSGQDKEPWNASRNLETPVNRIVISGFRWFAFLAAALESAGAETVTASPPRPPAFTNAALHPVQIKTPSGPPQVATGMTNYHGQPVMAACTSCHSSTEPNIDTRSAADLDQFHQGLKYVHGNLSCLSCHNAKNYDTLRLADSRPVEFKDVMTLCSQCHGPQRRDYDMGLHGGMNGYWDLTKGGRTRNTCINCHDPHAPAFPLVMPVFPPRDRISVPVKPTPPTKASAPAKH